MARAAAKKVKPRKRLTGDERRESILDAALACFLEKGYTATTINDIREASGATTGSIYHFFDGKGALAMALLEDAVAGWADESTPSSETPEAVIKASAGGLVSWGLKNPELFRFMDEVRTLAVTAPEFAGIADTLSDGQANASATYCQIRQGQEGQGPAVARRAVADPRAGLQFPPPGHHRPGPRCRQARSGNVVRRRLGRRQSLIWPPAGPFDPPALPLDHRARQGQSGFVPQSTIPLPAKRGGYGLLARAF